MSYSSPSVIKQLPLPSRQLAPKFSAIPPIMKPGFFSAVSNTQANKDVVVVFPCVPVTTRDVFPRMKYSFSSSAIEIYGSLLSRIASTSGLPRDRAFPITTKSGTGSKFFASYLLFTVMLFCERNSLMGG